MGIHKGTKLTENPKSTTIKARVDSDTVEKLDYLVLKKKSSRSDIIRQGIEIQYSQIDKEKE